MFYNRKYNHLPVKVIIVDWSKYWDLFLCNEKCYIPNNLFFCYLFKKIY